MFRTLVVDAVVPAPRTAATFGISGLADVMVDRYARKAGELRRLWTDGAGHTGDGSAWEGYNAAVQAIDHDRSLFRTRASTPRTTSLFDGTLARAKSRVLTNLVSAASAALN